MATTFKFGNGNWAVKDGYALAYNDENGNFKPLPFDFTRGSSATRVNKQGLVEVVPSGKPRIDFTDNTSGHLLLEPSRMNVITDSEISSTTPITAGDGTYEDTTLSNGLSGKKFDITSSGRSFVIFTSSVSSGVEYTLSLFAENFSGDSISNFVDVISGGSGEDFSSDLISDGKMEVSFTTTATSVTIRIGIGCTTTLSGTRSVEISGVQLEAGSYATSYIPTEGSSVTRSAEEANGAGNSTVFNDSEGVLFAEVAVLANDLTTRVITINDTSNQLTERVQLFTLGTSMYGRITDGGVTQGEVSGTPTLTDNNKIAFKYKANDFALWINGVEVDTSNSGSTPSGLDTIRFDAGTGGSAFYGKVKDLRYYNTALTDAELQNLTS